MPLQPRFRAPGASRPFVDREEAIDGFEQELTRVGDGPRVLNLIGIGGIGKSRLLRELAGKVMETHRTATLDLQVTALRQPDAALAVLRAEFGRQHVRFDHFDVAYAVWWQRMHPHLKVSRRELPFVEHSDVLKEVVDSMAGVPVFGTAVALLKLADATPSRMRGRRALSRSPVLQDLDNLSNTELADAVVYLFAHDLRAATVASKPYVLFIDAHEALVGEHARAGHVGLSDSWLRDLIAQLDNGLCVIASREPTRWEEYDPDWATVVRVLMLDDLPMQARLLLLESSGIGADREIAKASNGVPFYLNLAADTIERAGRPRVGTDVVSTEQILQRFLQHVSPEEVRLLELLSVSRMFDRGVFDAVANEYRLPGHQLAWDSITGYSFVTGTIGGHYHLHQLMVGALRSRIPTELATDVHRKLRVHWESRVKEDTAATMTFTDEMTSLREVIYHGLRAGEVDGDQLLGYADRIVALGGAARIIPIVNDVEEVLGTQRVAAANTLGETVNCLRAEAGYLAGAPDRPQSASSARSYGNAAQVRLALAEAHALRVLGDTRAALEAYLSVHTSGEGRTHLVAGLWAADLHMAQGRFRDAVDLTTEIRTLCPTEDMEMRADSARLLHLIHRFAFDFNAAGQFLEEAATLYDQASTANGKANIQTNRAELQAWTAPDRAIQSALEAIDRQREVGALHEIGKSRTALALAYTRLGDLGRAETEFERACADLDTARYRSGRARAELFRAILLARMKRVSEMLNSVRWAVEEFEATEVYPSMILGAAAILKNLGHLTSDIRSAADRARTRIRPLGSQEDLEERVQQWMQLLAGDLA